MDSINRGAPEAPPSSQALSPDSQALFAEGISLVLSRWTALQMAVVNEWGGRESRRKSDDFSTNLLSWFTQSKGPLYIDDLENMLDETMVLSFNTEVKDQSIEEIAEQLMIMHEDCLEGNHSSIYKLKTLNPSNVAISHCREVINENEDESSDEEMTEMIIDEPNSKGMAVDDELKPKDCPDNEGWSVVAPRRNRGKRSG